MPMPNKKQKKKKSKKRILVQGPKVSDSTALKRFDAESRIAKERAEDDRTRAERRFGGYGLDGYLDPGVSLATMMALTSTLNRKRRRVVESEERTYNKDDEEKESSAKEV